MCLVEGSLCFFSGVHMGYPLPCYLCWKVVPNDPNTSSLGNGEYNCLIVVGHVIGDGK